LEDVLAGLNAPDSYISTPTESKHNISISWNAEAGRFEVSGGRRGRKQEARL
jgi:hypothetical protein